MDLVEVKSTVAGLKDEGGRAYIRLVMKFAQVLKQIAPVSC